MPARCKSWSKLQNSWSEEVSLQVIIGLGAQIPLEANFFPGILEGLAGRLSFAPPGILNPPTSVREGLETGTTPSKENINTLECFVPRAAAWEPEPPEVITDHWLPILWEEGLLAECHPDQFTAEPNWVPLYTKDSLEKNLPAALSTFMNVGPPSLTAVVPPDFHIGTDREFLLTNFHQLGCLVRQSISIGGKHR